MLGVSIPTARARRDRRAGLQAAPDDDLGIDDRLADAPRPGRPPRITAEQVCRVVAPARGAPATSGPPIAHRSGREVADEIVRRGIVDRISPRHAGRLLKAAGPQAAPGPAPADTKHDEGLEAAAAAMCDPYREAPALAGRGERVVGTDELTGVQASERLHPGRPAAPGRVGRREFEYARHGTRAFLLDRDVVAGRVFAPACGATRTKADFVGHIRDTIATDPKAARWHLAADGPDIHRREPLIRLVAEPSDDTSDLGVMGESGVPASRASRAAYPEDASHEVVSHRPPVHASWLNRIGIWLSILARKVLRRGSSTSVDDLEGKVPAFIESYDGTVAKPFKWEYKPLKE